MSNPFIIKHQVGWSLITPLISSGPSNFFIVAREEKSLGITALSTQPLNLGESDFKVFFLGQIKFQASVS